MQDGATRFIPVVAIEQQHPGHTKMAGLIVAGCYAGAYMSRLVIVEDDIDITSPAEATWPLPPAGPKTADRHHRRPLDRLH